jgi:hypothetical protein
MEPADQRIEIAERAEALNALFVGLQLTLPLMLHPRAPLRDAYLQTYQSGPETPVIMRRQDGSIYAEDTIGQALERLGAIPHLNKGEVMRDLLFLGAMHGGTRLGDDLQQAGLADERDPLIQFARHFRNACAHGNRWHFRQGEPRFEAALRGRRLDQSLQGTRAVFDWVGPGDYLDYLDDLAAWLRQRA